MEANTSRASKMPGIVYQIYPAVGPVLLISLGYIDPGKWAVSVDGGARFGFDLLLPMLLFSCAAILCQYLAASIGVVTGKNLAEICNEEYSWSTCFFLGVQAEVSAIVLDLTMILGIAHGVNLLFGLELFVGVLLTAVDAVFFPVFMKLLEKWEGKFLFVSTAGFILLSYVFGVLLSQPEVPVVMDWTLTRLSGENAFVLMSLLGANIMPHNFYLHSSIVQMGALPNVSKRALCHNHLMSIICIFGGVYLVNYVLMSSAARIFHNAGFVVLTFQDAVLLIDQVPLALLLVLFISRQMISITWDHGGQVVSRDLFRMDLPLGIHHATVRTLAIGPALYCIWDSGSEGTYQLLILSQVILAMLLPSSVIPLFRVASSESIMGDLKISRFVEFLALTTFIGMLGLNVFFIVEMLFGYSDWVSNLRWNAGNSITLPYTVLLIAASAALILMLVLAATPLKSSSIGPDQQIWNWELQKILCEPLFKEEDNVRYKCPEEELVAEKPALEKSVGSLSVKPISEIHHGLPETILYSDQESHLPVVDEEHAIGRTSLTSHPEDPTSVAEFSEVAIIDKEVSDVGSVHVKQKIEPVDPVQETYGMEKASNTENDDCLESGKSSGKISGACIKIKPVDLAQETNAMERYSTPEKDDYDGDCWEPEELSRQVSAVGMTPTSEGPGSFRSLSNKSDESGSLSRLSGLGRAARRQLAAILDEFWGQLYDFHGQAAQQAKTKKHDIWSGLNQRLTASSIKVDPSGMKLLGVFPSVAEGGSTFPNKTSRHSSPIQQVISNSMGSPCGFQTGSTVRSTQMQVLDAYVKSSSNNLFDQGEKRYSSLRLPPLSEGWDYQPATVHGYRISSYLNRIATGTNYDSLSSQVPLYSDVLPTSCQDFLSYSPALKVVQNPEISGMLHAEKPFVGPCPSQPCNNVGLQVNTKNYHSLPDISGLEVPRHHSYLAERSSQNSIPPGFGPSTGRKTYGHSICSDSGSRVVAPLDFSKLSPSQLHTDVSSVQFNSFSDTKSIWSRQSFEPLVGVEGKTQRLGDGETGTMPSPVMTETNSHMDLETKLLQSFRYCIMKLLKLEGSDWLFRRDGGADEDLIALVAATERCYLEDETGDKYDTIYGSVLKNKEGNMTTKCMVSPIPCCGENCIWRVNLIVSFGVWCIHRILDLALMESRPELWGKYTYVLNRLQGILGPAFSKPRSFSLPCLCLQISLAYAKRLIPPLINGLLPLAVEQGRGKCTTASMVLDLIKDVEVAVSCRKGRTGTAAGEVAFPKGKENLASVLKRYKRRLSNKIDGNHEPSLGLCKVPMPLSYT